MEVVTETLTTPLSQTATLTRYILANTPELDVNRVRPAVLILPGGGYEMTSDREAEPVAMQMLARGYQAFVLRYSVYPAEFPVALIEACAAMTRIREQSAVWHVQPQEIVVAGFSAGGHLAASLATLWHHPLVKKYGYSPEQVRPDGLMLAYAVITSGPQAHRSSIDHLLGDQKDNSELLSLVSLEQQVTEQTPPTFIWHTVTDDLVPVTNSLLFMEALQAHQVPFEAHLYPQGGHGLSLGTKETAFPGGYGDLPPIATWVNLFGTWLETQIKHHEEK